MCLFDFLGLFSFDVDCGCLLRVVDWCVSGVGLFGEYCFVIVLSILVCFLCYLIVVVCLLFGSCLRWFR